jgi:branched-chain amino acid transport system permease protein
MIGGMLIAATESYTAAFLGSGWKDIAVFAMLILVLLFRPGGILSTLNEQAADERP